MSKSLPAAPTPRVAQGVAEIAASRRPRSNRCPGFRTPGCASVRRHPETGSETLRSAACEASRDRGTCCRGRCSAARARSRRRRASGRPRGHRSAAPPAMVCYPTARAREAHRRAQTAGGVRVCAPVAGRLMSPTVSTRSTLVEIDCQGPQACDAPTALAPGLRLRVVADRSVGAPGAAAVPQDALRDQRRCWARFLFEHCDCFRPLHRVAAWIVRRRGLPVSPGMLANSLKRFVPLFEPVADAILAHQNEAALRHADETGWRVQQLRIEKTGRAARGCGPRVSSDLRSLSISTLHAAPRRRRSCSAKPCPRHGYRLRPATVLTSGSARAFARRLVTLACCRSAPTATTLSSARPAR